jgi:hypothetical protein
VATPEGPCKVLDARCTGEQKTIKLDLGETSLQITPNHPVATQRGWIPAGHINPSDAILMQSTQRGLSWALHLKEFRSRLLSLMGIGIDATQTQNSLLTASISPAPRAYCTGLSGNFTTGLYRQGIRSIIKMETQRIIDWKTWSASASKSIDQSILMNMQPVEEMNFSKLIWKALGHSLRRGTGVQKESLGTKNMQKTASLSAIQTGDPRNLWSYGPVRFVQSLLRPITLARLSAQRPVHRKSVMTNCAKNSLVSLTNACAAMLSFLRFKQGKSIVVESATKPTTESAEVSLVYNLTIEKANCYFANRILVHNCDSMTQALLRFRTGGFLSLQSDDDDREPAYRRKVAYY